MAMVSFKKGLLANLEATQKVAGQFLITTDERAMYLDVDASTRIRLGDFQEFANIDALKANVNPSTSALYYVKDINCLAKWNGTEYIQINRDTGYTSYKIEGTGNAITAVAVNPENARELVLTKGATFATREYVGEIPEGYTETNVVAYINKKAEEVLTQATGGSSESAASVLAALNTYKAENDPKVAALQVDSHTHDNKTVLDGITAEKVTAWDEAEQNAKDYADEAAKAVQGETTGTVKSVEDALAAYKTEADAAIKVADDKAVAAQGEIDALEAKVGTVPTDKTVVQMIADAQTAATYDDTQVKADIKTNTDAITKLNANAETEGSVDYKIAQAVAQIIENPDETMNSINELVTWCNEHAEDALALSNQVAQDGKDIDALEALVGSTAVATQITDAIAAALKIDGVDKYALAADLTAAIARIATLEGATHTHANKELLDTYTQTEADLADAVAKKHEHANAAELDKIADGDVAKWNAAQANAEKTAADALATAKTELEGKITAEAERAAEAEAKALTDAKTYADEEDAKIEATIGTVTEGKTVVSMIADAETAAKAYTDTALTWGDFTI